MKIRLNFGLMDLNDVKKENRKCLTRLPNTNARIQESETGTVFVILESPYRYELVRYVKRYLGEYSELAESVVDENLVKD